MLLTLPSLNYSTAVLGYLLYFPKGTCLGSPLSFAGTGGGGPTFVFYDVQLEYSCYCLKDFFFFFFLFCLDRMNLLLVQKQAFLELLGSIPLALLVGQPL